MHSYYIIITIDCFAILNATDISTKCMPFVCCIGPSERRKSYRLIFECDFSIYAAFTKSQLPFHASSYRDKGKTIIRVKGILFHSISNAFIVKNCALEKWIDAHKHTHTCAQHEYEIGHACLNWACRLDHVLFTFSTQLIGNARKNDVLICIWLLTNYCEKCRGTCVQIVERDLCFASAFSL